MLFPSGVAVTTVKTEMSNSLEHAKAKAAATYNAAADHFDDETLGFWDRIGRRTVARLAVPSGAKVLDVGCGTGSSALPAAEAVGPDGSVVGVDLSDRLLERARTKASGRGLMNVDFIEADMSALGYPDYEFDAIISVFSIFFVPDMEGLVRELWRMVRPGGRMAITTWGRRMFEPAYSRWMDAVERERPDLYSKFNPWDRITSVGAVSKLLHDGGVSDPQVVSESGSQLLRSAADWWTIALGSGLRWTIEQMGPTVSARVRTDVLHWLQETNVSAIETNAIYATARKSRGVADLTHDRLILSPSPLQLPDRRQDPAPDSRPAFS
jgi:ubiquinone/menaquinone biosynthesis C-methylase UbiE